ncbi:MAG: hypothetical protein KY396_00185, partial [Actinobacteria bacterium]|nr:hypothetical protein [Actinomycetota bacterium]
RKIALGDSIKRVGRYEVPVDVFQDVRVEVKTLVVPEGGELPPEEELEAWAAEDAAAEAPPTDAAAADEETAATGEERMPDAEPPDFGDDEAIDGVEGSTPEFLDANAAPARDAADVGADEQR